MTKLLVLTLDGDDQPGVTAGISTALSHSELAIKQLEQIVLQGHLVLGLVLNSTISDLSSDDLRNTFDTAIDIAQQYAKSRNMSLHSRIIADSDLDHWRERLVVTVLGNPLVPASVAAITSTIAQAGGNIDRIRQVAMHPVTAIEFEVGGVTKLALRDQLSHVARANGIDIAVQESGLDRRGIHLVVMDVDSTLIQEEVIELLAAHAGVETEVTAITKQAMNGELDFEQSLRARVRLLKGLPASTLDEVQKDITLSLGAETVVQTLHALGFHVALVSGGFIEVVEPLAKKLGIQSYRANRLEVLDNMLTGELSGPIIDRAHKAEALREYAAHYDIPMSRTIAIGDGANDLDMLNAAALGIAFNAKPFVRDAAHASVNTPYLDTVLYVMGIPREHIERAEALRNAEGN